MRRLPLAPWMLAAALIVGGIGGFVLYDLPPNSLEKFDQWAKGVTGRDYFEICTYRDRMSCVVDGDTIWLGGQKIRIADIDAPEIFSPKCAYEEALGQRAKHRLRELLNAGEFQLRYTGGRESDRHGRLLRIIERDGQSLGEILISEGLARRWDGARRPWC